MTTPNPPSWDVDEAKARARAFLHSNARRQYSERRLTNDLDDLQQSAAAGMQILRDHGKELLQSVTTAQQVN